MPTTLTQVGDGIEGHKVTYRCRKWYKPMVVRGSGRDQTQKGKLEGSVFCVTDKRLRGIPEKH